jgi:hypothetical protein
MALRDHERNGRSGKKGKGQPKEPVAVTTTGAAGRLCVNDEGMDADYDSCQRSGQRTRGESTNGSSVIGKLLGIGHGPTGLLMEQCE